ncbi:hypothetical protein [Trueperella pyogenes]|nr:hypothetical protein [Trueperella pyogenes]
MRDRVGIHVWRVDVELGQGDPSNPTGTIRVTTLVRSTVAV